MKKFLIGIVVFLIIMLGSCSSVEPNPDLEPITCMDNQVLEGDTCVEEEIPPSCQDGYVLEGDTCVEVKEVVPEICSAPYVELDGECRLQVRELETLSVRMMEMDFDDFIQVVKVNHSFSMTDELEFDKLAAQEREKFHSDMTELDFFRVISKLISFINCSHSYTSLNSGTEAIMRYYYYYLPYDIGVVDRSIFIVRDVDETELPVGSEILSINGKTTEDIINEMYSLMPSDGENESFKETYLEDSFSYYYTVLIDTNPYYTIEYLEPNSETIKSVEIEGVRSGRIVPVSETYFSQTMSYSLLEEYVYFRLPNFNTINGLTVGYYETYFEDMFQDINDSGLQNLVIDIRHNNGGDPRVSNILLSYLSEVDFQYFASDMPPAYPSLMSPTEVKENRFSGEVYVISDGKCMSTSGHFLALIKSHDMATIVGEMSGAGYAVMDSSFSFDLTSTGVGVRISTVRWAVDVPQTDEFMYIEPDLEYELSIEEMIQRENNILEYIESLFE